MSRNARTEDQFAEDVGKLDANLLKGSEYNSIPRLGRP